MNVGILTYMPLWPLTGGSSLRVFKYVKEFHEQGHNVSVICPSTLEKDVKKQIGLSLIHI